MMWRMDWQDLGLQDLFTVCSRNIGKRGIMASTEMIAVVGREIGQRDLINTEREEKSESGD